MTQNKKKKDLRQKITFTPTFIESLRKLQSRFTAEGKTAPTYQSLIEPALASYYSETKTTEDMVQAEAERRDIELGAIILRNLRAGLDSPDDWWRQIASGILTQAEDRLKKS